MVFYTQLLPAELWFVIYKKEHEIHQAKINNEIRQLCRETYIKNDEFLFDHWYDGDFFIHHTMINPDGRPTSLPHIASRLWNINKYLASKK